MAYSSPLPGNLLSSAMRLRTGGACDLDPEHLLTVFGEQRRRFVAVLREFGPEDWAAPTRCASWSAHDVVRHLCDTTAIASTGDCNLDITTGFDPRITPCRWLSASDGESPGATVSRLVAATEELTGVVRARLARGRQFDVGLPYGPMDWTVLLLHAFWDSWIHERDVLLARDIEHPTDGDATGYAAGYGVFIAAAVAALFGDQVQETLMLDGEGGGVFDLDSRDGVTLTVSHADAAGPSAAEITDALAGRPAGAAALDFLPASSRAALSHLAGFFNTPVEASPA